MTTINIMKEIIGNMDTISIIVRDSNYWGERIKITHEEACRLTSGDLLYSHEIKVNSHGQHMTITVN
jgi:hypothetical protein